MGRASTRENKNKYQLAREELGWSREQASEELKSIPADRIVKIDHEQCLPYPEEVLRMAEVYKTPSLVNYYCSHQCPIGERYVPELKIKDLSQIVLEMLASLNSMNKKRDRLIEITADGEISAEEIDDFIFIQEELERISITVDTLQLWVERMIASGAINKDLYTKKKEK